MSPSILPIRTSKGLEYLRGETYNRGLTAFRGVV